MLPRPTTVTLADGRDVQHVRVDGLPELEPLFEVAPRLVYSAVDPSLGIEAGCFFDRDVLGDKGFDRREVLAVTRRRTDG